MHAPVLRPSMVGLTIVTVALTSALSLHQPSAPAEGIVLANHALEFPPLRPRGEDVDAETAEDAWAHIPGGPSATGGRFTENQIKSECKEVGGTYRSTAEGGYRVSTCSWVASGTRLTDYYTNGIWSHTEDEHGNIDAA
jgi:hypothetical protein